MAASVGRIQANSPAAIACLFEPARRTCPATKGLAVQAGSACKGCLVLLCAQSLHTHLHKPARLGRLSSRDAHRMRPGLLARSATSAVARSAAASSNSEPYRQVINQQDKQAGVHTL